MDFPSRPATLSEPPEELVLGLGMRPIWTGHSADDLLCELSDESGVRALKPDFGVLGRIPVRGVIVTARSSLKGFDVVSRFFAPASGIDEDPVTGSAHCTLAPFWSARLGRDVLRGWQASRRGGAVGMRMAGDRVELLGSAVTVWTGQLL
jgi:predicted PhzF superfamily epimerase YddE/YHI9